MAALVMSLATLYSPFGNAKQQTMGLLNTIRLQASAVITESALDCRPMLMDIRASLWALMVRGGRTAAVES